MNNTTISNTLRAIFGVVSALVCLGMMFSDNASVILWIPVLGLGWAAVTGKCLIMPIVGKALDKLDIDR